MEIKNKINRLNTWIIGILIFIALSIDSESLRDSLIKIFLFFANTFSIEPAILLNFRVCFFNIYFTDNRDKK